MVVRLFPDGNLFLLNHTNSVPIWSQDSLPKPSRKRVLQKQEHTTRIIWALFETNKQKQPKKPHKTPTVVGEKRNQANIARTYNSLFYHLRGNQLISCTHSMDVPASPVHSLLSSFLCKRFPRGKQHLLILRLVDEKQTMCWTTMTFFISETKPFQSLA